MSSTEAPAQQILILSFCQSGAVFAKHPPVLFNIVKLMA